MRFERQRGFSDKTIRAMRFERQRDFSDKTIRAIGFKAVKRSLQHGFERQTDWSNAAEEKRCGFERFKRTNQRNG